MIKYKVLFCVFLLHLTAACSLHPEINNYCHDPDEIRKPEIISSIKIDVSQLQYKHGFVSTYFNDSLNWYIGLDEGKNNIDIFDFNTQSYFKTIHIPIDGPFGKIQISDFYFHNPDTIFIFSEIGQKLIITNLNAEVIYQERVNLDAINKDTQLVLGIESFSGRMYYHQINKVVVLPAVPSIDISEVDYFNYNFLISFNIQEVNTTLLWGSYPPDYMKSKDAKDVSPVAQFFKISDYKDNLLVSFSASHTMLEFSPITGECIGVYCTRSQKISEIPKVNRDFDVQQAFNYVRSEGYYLGHMFDTNSKQYIRVVKHGQPLKNVDNKINPYHAVSWSIIVFDEQLTAQYEMYFDPRIHDFTKILVSKHGLLVNRENELNPENNEDYLEFDVIKI